MMVWSARWTMIWGNRQLDRGMWRWRTLGVVAAAYVSEIELEIWSPCSARDLYNLSCYKSYCTRQDKELNQMKTVLSILYYSPSCPSTIKLR